MFLIMATPYNCNAEVILLEQFADQFNNPDVSDVILKVGTVKYYAHRVVLAIQSQVFRTMLTGNRWREAKEYEIELQEDDEFCEKYFQSFLEFFYTGKINIDFDNLSSLLKLSDKYNVSPLKDGCSAFMMKQMGNKGDELGSIMKCISYINQYFPQYKRFCIDGINRNFADIEHYPINVLTLEDLKMILRSENGILTAPDELYVYKMAQRWILETFDETEVLERESAASHLIPLIRFFNMDATQIAEVKESPLGKLCADTIMKYHLTHAYEVQAEMFAYSVKSPKKRKLSGGRVEHKCSCNPSSGRCEHMNPRIYYGHPYGKSIKSKLDYNVNRIETRVVDLSSLETYIKIFGKQDKLHRWKVSWVTTVNGNGTSHCDLFRLCPPACHVGRTFDICIHVEVHSRDEQKKKVQKRYTIFKHGKLLTPSLIELASPQRNMCGTDCMESGKIDIAVYLS